MTLSRELQYAVILALYVQRAGRAQLSEIAKELRLSLPFLQQIARKLLKGGVLKSHRGRSGGYELVGDPKLRLIFDTLDSSTLLAGPDQMRLLMGGPEFRALHTYVTSLKAAMRPVLNRTIGNLNRELVANEVAQRERALDTGTVQ